MLLAMPRMWNRGTGEMKILCIGDSNTFGFDPRSFIGERYPEKSRWTERLKGHEVINWGINGITVPGDHTVFTDLVRRKDPDLVIVMLGTNDLLEGADAETTSRHMADFLDSLNVTGKKILLIAPPPLQYSGEVQSSRIIGESEKLGKLYRETAAEKGCLFADAGEWDIELVFDGVHFSETGHAVFAEELLKVLSVF